MNVDGEGDDRGGTAQPRRLPSTLLLVEDEPLIRMAIADELRDAGYRVLEAANAEEARAFFRADEPIALVISDIDLPGINGLALVRWAKAEFPDVRFILISGHPDHAREAAELARFVPKPFRIESLVTMAQELAPA